MSLAEQAIFQRLSSSTDVLSVVSTADRITPSHLPQNPTLPAITYHVISGNRVSAFSEDTGDASKRVQVSCWASRYSDVADLADKVRLALQRFSGSTVTTIQDVFFENEQDLPFDEDTETYHRPLDFRVWFKE